MLNTKADADESADRAAFFRDRMASRSQRDRRLYSYIVRVDDGAAPNPFGGMCSLAICKPKIRSTAQVGDWVAGVGSRRAPSGDLSGRLVYAMRVSEVVTLAEYDRRAAVEWPRRIPNLESLDLSDRLGDCIYDYSESGTEPRQRLGVHGPGNRSVDLGGANALIAKRDFFYFGSKAIELPPHLMDMCPTTQGHRSVKNYAHVDAFEAWIMGLGLAPGQLYGWPDAVIDWTRVAGCGGCSERADDYEGEC